MGWSVICDCGISWSYSLIFDRFITWILSSGGIASSVVQTGNCYIHLIGKLLRNNVSTSMQFSLLMLLLLLLFMGLFLLSWWL